MEMILIEQNAFLKKLIFEVYLRNTLYWYVVLIFTHQT